jgi:hypothetical protein
VYVYVPPGTPVTVVLVPVPVVTTAPGFLVSVHVPEGKPLNATLPVARAQVGAVINPITGAEGTFGCGEITTLPEGGDTHPNEFVTVKVNVPSGIFEMVVLTPDPVAVTAPGDLVIVQLPVIGRPFSTTLPDGTAQDGCVTVPMTGAFGLGD